MSTSSQKKKVTLYFNAAMLAETQKEALRQDRSISWIIQAAWRLAREEVKRMPGALSAGATPNAAQSSNVSSGQQPGPDGAPRVLPRTV
jgi:uncharacterized small protein (TIGR04563 family)